MAQDPDERPRSRRPSAETVVLALGVAAVLVGVGLTIQTLVGQKPTHTSAAKPSPASSSTPSPSPSPTPIPTPTPTPAPTQSFVVYIAVSQYGYVLAGTSSGASCALSGTYSDGSPVAGIRNPQVADANGAVQWTYPQLANPPGVPGGAGVHRVTCTLNGLTASDSQYFYARPQI